ncbi:MAG TPA: DUF6541 family protein [Candidatus Nanoarchaeia archaeon]|nr:DUF6541 family protein [Candidatus Nanoarchaeia archaeon]
MKLNSRNLEVILVFLLYLSSVYIWTLPIQKNPFPFGDVDASSHFTVGDFMVSTDHSIAKLPYPVDLRYGTQNSGFPHYIWYPPQYWTNTAIASIIGGDRIFSFFILIAVFSSLIVITSYFLIKKLFGFWPAFLSSLLLIFSGRDVMIYLWGQWPQSLSFALTPLVIYCFYRYYSQGQKNEHKPVYLYIMSMLIVAQYLFHPEGMIVSVATIAVFSLVVLIKDRKIFFEFKHTIGAALVIIILSALLAPFNFGEFFSQVSEGSSGGKEPLHLEKLFSWYHIKNDPGIPDFYFQYGKVHGSLIGAPFSYWTLPFLFFGIFTLFYRRKNEDWLLISWLVSLYFLTRLSIISGSGRDARMFGYEAHVFYPIIAIGLLSISSFFKNNLRQYVKYFLIACFIFLAVSVNGKSAYATLSSMQNSISRINPSQNDAAVWLSQNTPEDAGIYDCGTLGFQNFAAKIKWMGVLSRRYFMINNDEFHLVNYVLVDYTDAVNLRRQDYVNFLQGYEFKLNMTPVYNKGDIRIYKTKINKTCDLQ